MAAHVGMPVTPAALLEAAREALSVADLPAFDLHIERLLRIAPHWFEALFLAAAAFELRDPARAEQLYRRALSNKPASVDAAAGIARCLVARGAAVPLQALGRLGQLPPGPDVLETLRRVAARYGWRATGCITQSGPRLIGAVVPGAAKVVFQSIEDSDAATLDELLSVIGQAPGLACPIGAGPSFDIAAPAAGRYLAVLVDADDTFLGCLLPALTVKEVDDVAGEVWWSHAGVVSGWVRAEGGRAPQMTIACDPPAEPLALSVAPLAYSGAPVPAGTVLYGFAAVLPLDPHRRAIAVHTSATELRGSPVRFDGAMGLALTPALHSFELEPPDWHLLPQVERRFDAAPARDPVIDVIIPVYRDVKAVRRCVDSVLASRNTARFHIVVVNDKSPSPAVTRYVRSLAADPRVTIIENPRNLGFSGAVNIGLRAHPHRDVVLLNADTVVPHGWLDRLAACAAEDPAIASVTPLSNNATILSYPAPHVVNPLPVGDELHAQDRVFAAGQTSPIEIPTAVGFCMFIRRACLDDAGLLDEVNFGRGYGEENEFCLRSKARGWRHVCAPHLLVAHDGGVSFAGQHNEVVRRRLGALENTFKGYERYIQRFVHNDPLLPIRRAADLKRLTEFLRHSGESRNPSRPKTTEEAENTSAPPTILMIVPALTGGTARHIDDLCRALGQDGVRALVLSNVTGDGPGHKRVRLTLWQEPGPRHATPDQAPRDPYPNLIFETSSGTEDLAAALRGLDLLHIHIHHFLTLPWDVVAVPQSLGVAYDVTCHDYGWVCPRVTMVGATGRYCGEPDLQGCESCVATLGDRTGAAPEDVLSVAAHRARSAAFLTAARKVFVPSADVAQRLRRYAPHAPFDVRPHPFSAAPAAPRPQAPDTVAVVGAINSDKGYDVLLACARDAAQRNLPLRFAVVGFTQDDASLLQTGRAAVTGPYEEGEAAALLAGSGASVGWVPSVCPETWSYALSQILSSGLLPAAFDLGAPAQRLRDLGEGMLMPLALSAPQVNDALLIALSRARAPRRALSDAGVYPRLLSDYYGLERQARPPVNTAVSASPRAVRDTRARTRHQHDRGARQNPTSLRTPHVLEG